MKTGTSNIIFPVSTFRIAPYFPFARCCGEVGVVTEVVGKERFIGEERLLRKERNVVGD